MKTITILSGKGGVGKSSITASLAVALSKKKKIICADCDVDASNLALVFGIKEDNFKEWENITTNKEAVFDLEKCNSCKKCYDSCYFKAIDWINNKPKLSEFGCEGCGVCELICPENAIKLVDVDNAKIGYSETDYDFIVVSAQLKMGESGSGKLVAEVKKKAKKLSNNSEIMLVDSAAGIGCPVIASVTGSDYVVLVTEPTPAGFSDMKRALAIADHFNIFRGIIINKFDINKDYTKKIEDFADKHNIDILEKFEYDRVFVDALVNLTPVIMFDKKFKDRFSKLSKKIIDILFNCV